MFTMQNGFIISLPHLFRMQTHQATAKQFWKKFQYYYYTLTGEFVCLTFQDVIAGILYTNSLPFTELFEYWSLNLYTYGVVEEIRLFQS